MTIQELVQSYITLTKKRNALEDAIYNGFALHDEYRWLEDAENGLSELFEQIYSHYEYLRPYPVYCPIRHIQQGHNATIGAFRVLSDGRVFVRLDFAIINKMSAWCRIEDVLPAL
jgi:hypothetical protein